MNCHLIDVCFIINLYCILYNSMDAEQKEPLVEVIEKLLKDQTTVRERLCNIMY